MRRKVCYTFRRVVFRTIKRLRALKEGFNVKSGKSLKAGGPGGEDGSRGTCRLRKGLFSALFDCPESER